MDRQQSNNPAACRGGEGSLSEGASLALSSTRSPRRGRRWPARLNEQRVILLHSIEHENASFT
jgi:hypothetical protein